VRLIRAPGRVRLRGCPSAFLPRRCNGGDVAEAIDKWLAALGEWRAAAADADGTREPWERFMQKNRALAGTGQTVAETQGSGTYRGLTPATQQGQPDGLARILNAVQEVPESKPRVPGQKGGGRSIDHGGAGRGLRVVVRRLYPCVDVLRASG
jgi:hypothetical protein